MRRCLVVARRDRQRGWAGMLVLLIALAIVGFLAKDALMQYGLSSRTAGPVNKPAASVDRARDATSVEHMPDSRDAGRAATPIERARAVEDVVKRAAEEQARKMP